MAQISGLPPAAAPVLAVQPASERALAQAVGRLNQAHVAGEGREITFSVDAVTKRSIVRVVDVSTREVVNQWPAEYVLELDSRTVRDSG